MIAKLLPIARPGWHGKTVKQQEKPKKERSRQSRIVESQTHSECCLTHYSQTINCNYD
jgi:hypothetical protein